MTALTISAEGRIVTPAELRKKYSLTTGSKIHLVDYGGRLALIPTLEDPVRQVPGMLKGLSSLTEDLIEEHSKELERDECIRLSSP